MKFAGLLLSSFKRHRLRTTLTLLSIVVAFVLFGYLAAIRKAFQMGASVAGADRLVTRHKVSLIQPLPISYKPQIEQIRGVKFATHATWFGGIYKDAKNSFFAQMPVIPDEYFAMYPEFQMPAAQLEAWKHTRTGAVVGRKTATKFGWKIGDRVPIQATIWRSKSGDLWPFDIVGIYDGEFKETDTTQFLFRYDYFDENRAFGQGLVGWYLVRINDPAHAESIAQAIDEHFANSAYETKTETEKAFIKGFAEQMGNIGKIVTFILTAVFFTILLVAGNTMAQSVRERVSELGVMKAIGFTDTAVLVLVLAESCMIAIAGGAIGLALSWMLVSRGDPTGGALPIFFFPARDLLLGIAFVVFLGLVSGLLPALQAMRLNTVEALRRE